MIEHAKMRAAARSCGRIVRRRHEAEGTAPLAAFPAIPTEDLATIEAGAGGPLDAEELHAALGEFLMGYVDEHDAIEAEKKRR